MTEKSDAAYDLFVRQAYMSANRLPVLLGGMEGTLIKLDQTIDAEVGFFGTGTGGFPEVKNAVEADNQIFAAQCLNYAGEVKDYCRSIEYNGTCWIDRDDYTPERKQNAEPGGRAGWHPGHRVRYRSERSKNDKRCRSLAHFFYSFIHPSSIFPFVFLLSFMPLGVESLV